MLALGTDRHTWLNTNVHTIMYVALVFEFDPIKAAQNLKDHAVSFETAQEVFDDPHQVVSENYFYAEDGEQRWQIIGMTGGLTLLLVIYVDHSDRENEIIRLISARKADVYEEGLYTDQFA